MHKMLIATLSAFALMTGVAAAQAPAGNATVPDAQNAPVRGSLSPSLSSGGAPSVEQLMNKSVVGADDKTIGKVTDVILGPDGQAQLIVVRSGGFLGIGGKDIAADMKLVEVDPGSNALKLRDVTQASVRDMPEFRYDDSMTSLNRSPQRDAPKDATKQ